MSSELNRRVFLKRAGQFGGLVVAGGSLESLLAACGGNVTTPTTTGTQAIGHAGLLVPSLLQWGSTANGGAPYVFQDPNNPSQLVGFEVEIAQAFAQLIGVQEKQIETDYTQLDQALQADKFDMIMNGWEKTGDRYKTELFSDPYYHYGQQIVVKANDPRFASKAASDTLSLKDLEGYTVGTGAGFKAADVLATDSKITLKIYDPDLPFADLALGRIDAVLIDLPIVTYYVEGIGAGSTKDKRLRAIGKPIAPDDYYIAFRKNGPNGKPYANGQTLLKEINAALAELKTNGALHRIYTKWGLWNDQQAAIGIK
jgi:polar amino acid transport system substrate-binding protein